MDFNFKKLYFEKNPIHYYKWKCLKSLFLKWKDSNTNYGTPSLNHIKVFLILIISLIFYLAHYFLLLFRMLIKIGLLEISDRPLKVQMRLK